MRIHNMNIYHRATRLPASGFTIVEMMIAIAIVTVLTAIALPNLTQFLARNNLAGATNEIIAGINQARAEAIARSSTVTICPSNNGNRCNNGNWERGWLVFSDPNANRAFDAGEDAIAISSGVGSASIDVDGLNAGLSFNATGILNGFAAGNITLVHADLAISNQLVISTVGQVDSIEILP